MGIRTVMITGDNPLTAKAIADEAGVDDFLAEATPEDKMALIKREQEGGKLVAMTGDGTNDAPALAQADVGVAMNTGTSAAKEAGNMVDLDSDPTKLIEIVEIGKQLLITRGALTTFSIANDIAKYFAIIPAMFAAVYPGLDTLNIMRLHSPTSAILSAVIFNALIIVALIPLALRGVRYTPGSAAAMLRRNLLVYGARRHHRPVHRHQDHRPPHPVHPRDLVMRLPSWIAQHLAALRALLVLTVLLGTRLPAGHGRGRPDPRPARPRRRIAASAGRQRPSAARSSARPSPTPTATRCRSTSSPARRRPATATTRPRPSASNLGPESIVDTLPDPSVKDDTGKQSLLTQVCARSKAVGELEGVDGAPAVLHPRRRRRGARRVPPRRPHRPGHPGGQPQRGLPGHPVRRPRTRASPVECAKFGEDYIHGRGHPDPRRRAGRPGGAGRRGHRQRQRARPGTSAPPTPSCRRPGRQGARRRPGRRSTR